MSRGRIDKLHFWEQFRRRNLKRIYLVDLMAKIESEILFLMTTKQLLGKLSEYDTKRYLRLSKYFKWLRRIYKGMTPWRLT